MTEVLKLFFFFTALSVFSLAFSLAFFLSPSLAFCFRRHGERR